MLEESDMQIAAAREEVLRWVRACVPGDYPSNAELSEAFAKVVGAEADLELRTVWNPSACVFEARWYHGGRETAEFSKPFCAEEKADARLLACAGMVRLS